MTKQKEEDVYTEPLIDAHTAHKPPWRDRMADGTLGPWWGPTESQFLRMSKEHRDSLEGGGLWDLDKLPSKKRAREKRLKEARLIMHWVMMHSAEIGQRHLECIYHIWRDGREPGWVAREMGVHIKTVRTWMKRARERARERARKE